MRPLLRPSTIATPTRQALRAAPRRLQSTSTSTSTSTTDAAAKARQAAADVSAKASQGLSRVATAAGPALAGAARGLSTALGRVGGRTGKLIAFAESYTPFVVYYARVGLELSRLVFQGQKMSPPSIEVFQSYFQNAWKQVQNPGSLKFVQSPATVLQRARTLSPAQLAAGGVIAAECIGFFTVGEIIGRFKLIGYRGDVGHAAH